MPTMGGQTGLNIAKELSESGILDKYGVELLGAKLPSIDRAEDRDLFKQVPSNLASIFFPIPPGLLLARLKHFIVSAISLANICRQ